MAEYDPGAFEIMGCGPSVELAQQVAGHLGLKACTPGIEFANHEVSCTLPYSLREQEVFIISSHADYMHPDGTRRSPQDAFMGHMALVDAAKRSWARRIIVVAPFLGYGRADHLTERQPLAASLAAQIMEVAGATGLMTFDPHASATQGFFRGPSEFLKAAPVLLNRMQEVYAGEDQGLVFVSPDRGRIKASGHMADRLANRLGRKVGDGVFDKVRDETGNGATVSKYLGASVKGQVCVLNDDMSDGGGTLAVAAERLVELGAAEVDAWVTHAVMSGNAADRLRKSPIRRLFVTDTIPLRPDILAIKKPEIEVVSLAAFLAEAISCVHDGRSIQDLHGDYKQHTA